MIKIIKQYIDEHHLIPAGIKTVYAAVSGGIDSCVMLEILYQLRKEYAYNLVILHYNHGTRGKESQNDEYFVEQLAEKYGLKIIIGRLKTKSVKISETYLRDARLKFFEKHVQVKNSSRLATGHNLNDNVETFIMRMAKGSRLKGLLSIRPSRGIYIRPLLAIDRQKIFEYARSNQLDFREDIANRDVTILRNNIRHEIIPYLEKSLSVDLKQNISRIIKDLYRYHTIYEQKLQEVIRNVTKITKTGISLHRKRYLMYDESIRRGLIEYCVSGVYPLNYKVSDRNLLIWDDFIAQAQVGKNLLFLDEGVAIAERQYIMFGHVPREKKEIYKLKLGVSTSISKSYRIRFQQVDKEKVTYSTDNTIEFIDGDKSGPLLTVRFWKAGDSFHPLGMSNKRKLSDFFTDLKINNMLKKNIPLVCKGNDIVWIAGYRLDDKYKISDKTKKIYKLEIKNTGRS